MKVQHADLSNLREIADFLITKFHASYSDVFPPADFAKVVLYVGSHLNSGIVFIVRNDQGELGGVITGMEASPWFSTRRHISEGVFFVAPEMRQSRAAVLLLKALQRYAADKGMALMCGVSCGDDLERKDKFFALQGMERIGGIYKTKDKGNV